MRDIIRQKRDGGALDAERITSWIRGVADGMVPDYQSSALLMAIVGRGMTRELTVTLTNAMLPSGRVLDWTSPRPADGGQALDRRRRRQGLDPAGARGRGLRRRGADDLGARPGAHRRHARQARGDPRLPDDLPAERSMRCCGAAAWRWAARPPTSRRPTARSTRCATSPASIESVPLIVASIVSKKAASGTKAIVYDVKCGWSVVRAR